MTSPNRRSAVHHAPASPLVRFEPIRLHHMMFDGRWWPGSSDPAAELRALVPLLDRVNGPVCRLLLSAAGWTKRPHHIAVGDRTISLGYFSDQPPTTLTALCVDGGTVELLVTPSRLPGPRSTGDEPSPPDGEDPWESEGGQPAAHRGSPLGDTREACPA